jgi:hypothetical protein
MRIDWGIVHRLIRERPELLCRHFFPAGKRVGHEWLIGNLRGDPGESLKFELEGEKAGVFIDFATQQSGSFLDALVAALGLDLAGAAEAIGRALGVPIWNGTGPNPAHQYRPNSSQPNTQAIVIDWDRDYKPGAKQLEELVAWRGYSLAFCQWLADERYIGRSGPCWVIPVKNARGEIVAIHKRLDKNKWQFIPTLKSLGMSLTPLVVGDLTDATWVIGSESQWDLFGVLDTMGIHNGERIAGVTTRGAGNAALVGQLTFTGELYAVGQNDEPGRAWLEALKVVHCFKWIIVPPDHHDVNEWLQTPEGPVRIVEAFFAARVYRSNFPPPLIMGKDIQRTRLPLPPVIIEGLLSRGEKFQLAGGSKSSKSWVLIDLGISVAAGLPWWGFKTVQTPVIYLNLEIPRPFFEMRVREVAAAHHIPVPELFTVWHLRGARLYEPDRWAAFKLALIEECKVLAHPLILNDPLYKLMGRGNELHTGDVQTVLDQLEEIVELVEGANASSHHYSKGNQANKEAIDRASGSGVFQRDPDTLFPITPLATADCFSIEPYVRNHEPVKPFAIRWQYPLFFRDDTLDPADLKAARKSAQAQAQNKYIDPEVALKFLTLLEVIPKAEFMDRLTKPGSNGRAFCAKSRAYEIFQILLGNDRLIETTENRIKYVQKK